MRRLKKHRPAAKYIIAYPLAEMLQPHHRHSTGQKCRQEKGKAVACLPQPQSAHAQHQVCPQKDSRNQQGPPLVLQIQKQGIDHLQHGIKKRPQHQNPVDIHILIADAPHGQKIAPCRQEHQAEHQLKLHDILELRPQGIEKLLPGILNILKISLLGNIGKIHRILLIKFQLHGHHEHNHGRQDGQKGIKGHHIIPGGIQIGIRHRHPPGAAPDNEVCHINSQGIEKRHPEQPVVHLKIRQELKIHPLCRIAEIPGNLHHKAAHNQPRANAHGHHGACHRLHKGKMQVAPCQEHAGCTATPIAEENGLVVLQGRQVHTLQPHCRHLHKEHIGSQLQFKSQWLVPVKSHRRHRPQKLRQQNNAVAGSSHILILPLIELVRQIPGNHHGKAAGKKLGKNKGINHRGSIQLPIPLCHPVLHKQQLNQKHHGGQKGKGTCRNNSRIAISHSLPRQGTAVKKPFQLKSDTGHQPCTSILSHFSYFSQIS